MGFQSLSYYPIPPGPDAGRIRVLDEHLMFVVATFAECDSDNR